MNICCCMQSKVINFKTILGNLVLTIVPPSDYALGYSAGFVNRISKKANNKIQTKCSEAPVWRLFPENNFNFFQLRGQV